MTLLIITLTSVLYLTSAQRECDVPAKRRNVVQLQQQNCDCLAKRAGQMKFAEGKVLVCDGSEWKALQYEVPYGSRSKPGYSCEDIRTVNIDSQTKNGVYFISQSGSRGNVFPVYCDMVAGGWTMVFKAVSGVDKDAYEVYNSAFTYSEKAMAALDATDNYGDHYKNRIILNWNNFGPSEARVVLYKEGSMVKELKFDARGTDKFNWFRVEKLTNSPWNDIKKEPRNYFSIIGDNGLAKRRFFINRNYGGCPNDHGWMVIIGPACDWEKRRQQLHMILYSKEDGYVNWDKGNVGEADVLAVYVR